VPGRPDDGHVDLERHLGRAPALAALADLDPTDLGPFGIGLVVLDDVDHLVQGRVDHDRAFGVLHARGRYYRRAVVATDSAIAPTTRNITATPPHSRNFD